jgi:hypothetical protein
VRRRPDVALDVPLEGPVGGDQRLRDVGGARRRGGLGHRPVAALDGHRVAGGARLTGPPQHGEVHRRGDRVGGLEAPHHVGLEDERTGRRPDAVHGNGSSSGRTRQ